VSDDTPKKTKNKPADAAKKEGAAQLEDVKRPINKFVAIGTVVMLSAVAASIFFAFKFVEDERARSLQEWQVRLGIVADSRSAAINDWLGANFKTMRELAENASLQLYMSEIVAAQNTAANPAAEDDPFGGGGGEAETTYLRNILTATAERTGFKPPAAAAEVSANIERAGEAGLGLIDADGKPLASSPGMPPMIGKLKEAGLKALEGEPAVIDIYIGPTNLPTIGFALPVYGIQDSGDGAKGIGAVIGVKVIDNDLFAKLVQPGETSQSSETYLVRAQGAQVEYLSPLKDGTPPLKRALAIDTAELAGAYAVNTPGGFGLKRDYTGEEVLMVSRPIAGVPWILVRKVNRAEALADTETRLKTILTVFILIIVGVTISVFAVWRHGSSLRATQAAENFKVSSERFENLSKFMNLISNAQPAGIVAVNGNTVYTYANEPAAKDAGIPAADMIGKTMAAVLGPIKAQVYTEINDKILKRFAETEDREACRQMHINTFGDDKDDDTKLQVIKSDHIPLRGDRDHPPGVLMILEDITELTRERRRSEKMLRQLIDTLVSVVDRRDPFSANHSKHVAEVAKAIAQEMGCDEVTAKTVDIAGSLMNLGKIFIPPDLLTKTGDLTPEERQTLMSSYLVSVDLLKDVTFEGPVVDTIRDMGETWDGNGPLGKAGEDIMSTARMLAVANAFVGMVSARAYREAMPFEKASDILLSDTGSKFDRKPVSALINFLENREGKIKWAHYRVRPSETETSAN